jgi:hypothetical protein
MLATSYKKEIGPVEKRGSPGSKGSGQLRVHAAHGMSTVLPGILTGATQHPSAVPIIPLPGISPPGFAYRPFPPVDNYLLSTQPPCVT